MNYMQYIVDIQEVRPEEEEEEEEEEGEGKGKGGADIASRDEDKDEDKDEEGTTVQEDSIAGTGTGKVFGKGKVSGKGKGKGKGKVTMKEDDDDEEEEWGIQIPKQLYIEVVNTHRSRKGVSAGRRKFFGEVAKKTRKKLIQTLLVESYLNDDNSPKTTKTYKVAGCAT